MAFLEGLDEAAASEAGGFSRSQLGQLVNAGLDEGLSANAMLQSLQASGIGTRRSDFLSLVRQVQAARSQDTTWSDLALDSLPTAQDAVEWSGGSADTYLYRVRLFIREGGVDGLGFYEGNFDIVSDDLISPQEAMDRAQDIWDSGEGQGKYANRELWGTGLGGIYHQLGAQ